MNGFMLKAGTLMASAVGGGGGGTNTQTLGRFIASFQLTLARYASMASSIIGIAMVIVALYQVAKNLMSGGKRQTNWVSTIALLLIGGVLALTGGWSTVGKLVNTGNATLADMAEGNPDTTGSASDPFSQK